MIFEVNILALSSADISKYILVRHFYWVTLYFETEPVSHGKPIGLQLFTVIVNET